MATINGYLCLILHAHLPFVRHPENDDFLEEDWLYEAIRETYLPLLDVMQRLHDEGIFFRLTLSISPTLSEMLSDPLLQKRFRKRLHQYCELSEKEVRRTSKNPYKEFHETALLYQTLIQRCLHIYDGVCQGNILRGFKKFQDLGMLELITCAATHGFLPLMITPQAVRGQLEIGKQNFIKHFGSIPQGIWLPECGYDPAIESFLEEAEFEYYFLENHGLINGDPQPAEGAFAPIKTPAGLYAFARDVETARQVWSREIGYPGDFEYREFYRDLGYDAFYDYIEPYLHQDGVRRSVGFKYHRITGDKVALDQKQPYRPALARARTSEHTLNFLDNRRKQFESLQQTMSRQPLIVAPFDAELFGHWWFEGIHFIESLFRHIDAHPGIVPVTPSEYLREQTDFQISQPVASSWGHKGHYDVWVNQSNDWIYRHLHHCETRMHELAAMYSHSLGLRERTLNQMARELLLAQSSDWAFIMTSNTAVSYASRRTREHINRFLELEKQIESGNIDETYLKNIEWRDNLFAEIDYRVYA